MNNIIDYCMFVIKPDKNSRNPFHVTLEYVIDLLEIRDIWDNFVPIGGKNHYHQCYYYNNIRVYESSLNRLDDMGFCVEMSGQGCRYIEALYKEKHNKEFCWYMFFQKLMLCTSKGCSLNINRIDFAYDDFDGLLNLDTIEQSAKNLEYVSLFRDIDVYDNYECIEWGRRQKLSRVNSEMLVGKTIYFGSRKSNCFCRFYDKLVEQKQKNRNNPEVLEQLGKIKHWVRFEIVFKKTTAIKIVNAMACLNSNVMFNRYLAEVINSYIRFIDIDDSNVTRCTVKKWWSDFIGTAERASITAPGIKKDPLSGAVAWLKHSLAPTLCAMIQSIGIDEFMNLLFEDNPELRYKQKHYEIINKTGDFISSAVADSEMWCSLIPEVVLNRLLDIQNSQFEFENVEGEQLAM